MPSVAEVWLADDLAGLEDHPLPRLHADLYRCTRETGWRLKPFAASPTDELMEPFAFRAPHDGPSVEMRVHRIVPVLGFVDDGTLHASIDVWASSWVAWGHPYVNPAALVKWWQGTGWLVPDAAWFNANPTVEEMSASGLKFAEGPKWRHWRELSRGDALFFEW